MKRLLTLSILLLTGCSLVQNKPWHSSPITTQPVEVATGEAELSAQLQNEQHRLDVEQSNTNFWFAMTLAMGKQLCGKQRFYLSNLDYKTGGTVNCVNKKLKIHIKK
jgi:hypothetical protein